MITKPKPPESLDPEARKEWVRVCSELEQAGTLDSSYRAILIQYVTAWSINRAAAEVVLSSGTNITHNNGVVAHSPEYKAWKDTAALVRGLLNDLGLTPASKANDKAAPPKLGPLQY